MTKAPSAAANLMLLREDRAVSSLLALEETPLIPASTHQSLSDPTGKDCSPCVLVAVVLGVRHCDRKKVTRYRDELAVLSPSYSPETYEETHKIRN